MSHSLLCAQLAAKYPFADSDYGYFAYGNALGSTTQQQGARLEQLTSSLAERVCVLVCLCACTGVSQTHTQSGAGSVTAAQLRSARRDADACDALTDVVDGLLEAADFDLDEAKGATDHKTVAVSKTEVVQSARSFSATLRPQRSFPDKVDNSRLPFVPKITSKPNALTELPQWAPPRPGAFDMYPHPYLAELAAFQPSDSLLTRCEPVSVICVQFAVAGVGLSTGDHPIGSNHSRRWQKCHSNTSTRWPNSMTCWRIWSPPQ